MPRPTPAVLLLAAVAAAPLAGQGGPDAAPSDVASPDAIVAALYDVISGPAGQALDWERFRSLFVPDARLIPTGPRQGGGFVQRAMSVDDYATQIGPRLEAQGFFEDEIGHREDRFGEIVHRFSAYASREAPGAEPFARGINSIQLWSDGQRWYVVTILWEAERGDLPLPSAYLGG